MTDRFDTWLERIDRAWSNPDTLLDEFITVFDELCAFLDDRNNFAKAFRDGRLGLADEILERIRSFLNACEALRRAADRDTDLADAYGAALDEIGTDLGEIVTSAAARSDQERIERALLALRNGDPVPLRRALPRLATLISPRDEDGDADRWRKLLTEVSQTIQPPKRPRGGQPKARRAMTDLDRRVSAATGLADRIRRHVSPGKARLADRFAVILLGCESSTDQGDSITSRLDAERHNARRRRNDIH